MNLFLFIWLVLFCYFNQILALTPDERKEFLDFHNRLRRSVVPTASNMQELEYDENIEKSVYEFLENCKFEHRMLDGYGENGRLATDSNITDTVMSWFQERTFFNISAVGDQRCSKENSKQEYLKEIQCGHYKMMVKGSLKSLGCGYKFCEKVHGMTEEYDNSYITYCFYNSGQKDQPYEIGKPCSDCSTEYQFCKDDLCVPKKRYADKTLRTCQVKCKNCADYFDSKNSCLCDCPEGTDGNSCIGTPNIIDKICTPCSVLGETCNNGVENVISENCNCKCSPEYQGEYCEIRKDQYAASYYFIINGINWRYNMMVPVNIVKFKNTFSEFQGIISNIINKFCIENQYKYPECKSVLENPINSNNVLLISGFPKMLENGSIAIRMFIDSSVLNNEEKQERYLSPSILNQIWSTKSIELEKFIENVMLVNSPNLQYYDQMLRFMDLSVYQDFSESASQQTNQNTNENTLSSIATYLPTNIPDNSNTDNSISTDEPKMNSTKESINNENTKLYSEISTLLTTEFVQPINYTSTMASLYNDTETTEFVNTSNGTIQQINSTITTVSTNYDPKTTEKKANVNCQVLKSFIFLEILFIYITL